MENPQEETDSPLGDIILLALSNWKMTLSLQSKGEFGMDYHDPCRENALWEILSSGHLEQDVETEFPKLQENSFVIYFYFICKVE